MDGTPEIAGLNEGVGLVPQGRLGSGIANVFDTSSVAANLARLGARMENLEKLKMATAAKLATAKQKEAVVKAPKLNPFEAPAVSGKSAFRSGNKVVQKLFTDGLQNYQTKKGAGDIDGANQEIPLTKYGIENANNKTASIESEIDSWWKNGAGKFYLPNPVVESNIETTRPDNITGYLQHQETPVRTEQYLSQPATYNFDAVGQWAKDNSGRTSFSKTFADGKSGSATGISALYQFPMDKKGNINFDAPLEVDYPVAQNFFASNPDIRAQMNKMGKSEVDKILDDPEYKKATTDEERKKITDAAYNKGVNSYIDMTLQGRADKDVKKDLESTYHKAAAAKKAEGDVDKDYQFANQNYSIRGRFDAQSIADPKQTKGFSYEYNYGVVPTYNFKKNPQELTTGTDFVPMGDPKVLEILGIVKKTKYAAGKTVYTLTRNVKFGSANYIGDAKINQTPNRVIAQNYLMPTGILVPTSTAAYTTDTPVEGYALNISTGPISTNLSKAQLDYLEKAGIDLTQMNVGLEIPMFVEKNKGAGANLSTFIQNEFPNTLPKGALRSSNY